MLGPQTPEPRPTRRSWLRGIPGLALALCAAALTLACGEPTREEMLQAAIAARAEALEETEAARAALEETRTALREAEEAHAEASQALVEAEKALAEADAQVGLYATDDVLFRAVQKALLESPDLANAAISARVTDGVVTLTGEAPSAEVRDRAVEVAGAIPGVGGVESRVTVPAAAADQSSETL